MPEPGDAGEEPEVARGLAMIRAGDWYAAHEVLEGPWRRAEGPRKTWLHALIHGAVALEHLRRGNPRGCWGQWRKCEARLVALPDSMGGVDLAGWGRAWRAFAGAIALEERSRRHVAGLPLQGLPDVPPEVDWPLP